MPEYTFEIDGKTYTAHSDTELSGPELAVLVGSYAKKPARQFKQPKGTNRSSPTAPFDPLAPAAKGMTAAGVERTKGPDVPVGVPEWLINIQRNGLTSRETPLITDPKVVKKAREMAKPQGAIGLRATVPKRRKELRGPMITDPAYVAPRAPQGAVPPKGGPITQKATTEYHKARYNEADAFKGDQAERDALLAFKGKQFGGDNPNLGKHPVQRIGEGAEASRKAVNAWIKANITDDPVFAAAPLGGAKTLALAASNFAHGLISGGLSIPYMGVEGLQDPDPVRKAVEMAGTMIHQTIADGQALFAPGTPPERRLEIGANLVLSLLGGKIAATKWNHKFLTSALHKKGMSLGEASMVADLAIKAKAAGIKGDLVGIYQRGLSTAQAAERRAGVQQYGVAASALNPAPASGITAANAGREPHPLYQEARNLVDADARFPKSQGGNVPPAQAQVDDLIARLIANYPESAPTRPADMSPKPGIGGQVTPTDPTISAQGQGWTVEDYARADLGITDQQAIRTPEAHAFYAANARAIERYKDILKQGDSSTTDANFASHMGQTVDQLDAQRQAVPPTEMEDLLRRSIEAEQAKRGTVQAGTQTTAGAQSGAGTNPEPPKAGFMGQRRTFMLGGNAGDRAVGVFDSASQKAWFDAFSKAKKGGGGVDSLGRPINHRHYLDSLGKQLGLSPEEAWAKGEAVYNDVRAQMKGVEPDSEVVLKDNVGVKGDAQPTPDRRAQLETEIARLKADLKNPELWKDFGGSAANMGVGLVVAKMPTYVKLGAHYLELGVRDFAAWALKLREVDPSLTIDHLKQIWQDAHGLVGGREVSTRVVTGVKPLVDHNASVLVSNLSDVRLDPIYEAKMLEAMRASGPALRGAKTLGSVVDQLRTNLVHLYDASSDYVKKYGKLWYDGGNRIASRWGANYGKSVEQMAGMIAVHSPQTDWFMNVSRAERVADILSKQGNTVWDDAMTAAARSRGAFTEADIAALQGRKLDDLTSSLDKAKWVRAFDEAHNPRGYRTITPDGRFGDTVLTGKGAESNLAWGSFNHIAKSIDIWEDGSAATISAALGKEHKVRNFYNNLVAPNSPRGHYTSDTHNAAAAHLSPLSGDDATVTRMLGGAPSQANLGYSGTYPVYHQAGIDAAKAVGGLHPREMQSVTWETVRELFKNKSPKVKAEVAGIWEDYANGKISHADAWDKILARSGGIDDPSWVASLRSASERRSSYLPGDVHQGELGVGSAKPMDGGTRVGTTGSTPGLGSPASQSGLAKFILSDEQYSETLRNLTRTVAGSGGAGATDAFKALVKIGAHHLASGATKFGAWSSKVLNDVPAQYRDKVKPQLRAIWEAAHKEAGMEPPPAKGPKVPTAESIQKQIDRLNTQIAELKAGTWKPREKGQVAPELQPLVDQRDALRKEAARLRGEAINPPKEPVQTTADKFGSTITNLKLTLNPLGRVKDFTSNVTKLASEGILTPFKKAVGASLEKAGLTEGHVFQGAPWAKSSLFDEKYWATVKKNWGEIMKGADPFSEKKFSGKAGIGGKVAGMNDAMFRETYFRSHMRDWAISDILNKGEKVTDDALKARIASAPKEQVTAAQAYASRMTFNADNALGDLQLHVRQMFKDKAANDPTAAGMWLTGQALWDATTRFTRVITNVAQDKIRYTPAGVVEGIVRLGTAIKRNKGGTKLTFDEARMLSEVIAKGTVGSAGMAIGYILWKQGIGEDGNKTKWKPGKVVESDSSAYLDQGAAEQGLAGLAPAIMIGQVVAFRIERAKRSKGTSDDMSVAVAVANELARISVDSPFFNAADFKKDFDDGNVIDALENLVAQQLPTGSIAKTLDSVNNKGKFDPMGFVYDRPVVKKEFKDKLKAQIPGMRGQLKTKRKTPPKSGTQKMIDALIPKNKKAADVQKMIDDLIKSN